MSDARRFRSGSMENRRLTLSLGLARFLLEACSTLDAPPRACSALETHTLARCSTLDTLARARSTLARRSMLGLGLRLAQCLLRLA